MQKPDKKTRIRKKNSAHRGRVQKLSRVLFMPMLIVVFSVAVVYATVVVGRLTNEVSHEIKLPTHIVRLQVLNASSNKGAMRDLCQLLSGFQNEQLEFRIVDTSRIRRLDVPESLVISREANLTAAILTSELVGCRPSELEFRPMEFNTDLVTVTILIGENMDMQKLRDNLITEDS